VKLILPPAVILMVCCAFHPPAQAQEPRTRPGQLELPHIELDVAAQTVTLEATVTAKRPDWLELVACTVGGRDHESVVTTPALPSHIHLALVMIGLEPGSVADWKQDEQGQVTVIPATGPPLRVDVVYQLDGERQRHPVSDWVYNQQTLQTLNEMGWEWVFAGSRFMEHEGREIYLADVNGTVISLVNFRDDLIVRPTDIGDAQDEQRWQLADAALPMLGRDVKLVISPVE